MLQKKLSSFKFAFNGLVIALKEEFNFRVHVVLAALAIFLGVYFDLNTSEWLFVVAAIGLVITAELFNTALEELCDMLNPIHDPHVAKIKDLSASAVLTASFAALIIGLTVFLPHFV